MNMLKKGFQPRTTGCQDKEGRLWLQDNSILERWAQHFEVLLNNTEQQTSMEDEQAETETEEDRVQPPTIEEVKRRIDKIKK